MIKLHTYSKRNTFHSDVVAYWEKRDQHWELKKQEKQKMKKRGGRRKRKGGESRGREGERETCCKDNGSRLCLECEQFYPLE